MHETPLVNIEHGRDCTKGRVPQGPLRDVVGVGALVALGLLLTALLLTGSTVHADSVINVGIYDYSPLAFLDAAGKPQDIYIDILEKIAAEEDSRLNYVFGTWLECLAQLDAGQIDVLVAIAYSDARAAVYAFCEEPVFLNWGQVYAASREGINDVTDLQGKTIAAMSEDIHTQSLAATLQKFDLESTFIMVGDYASALALVRDGDADAGVVSRLYGELHAQEFGLIATGIVFNPVQLRIAGPKGRSEPLLAAIDGRLRSMKDNPDSVYYASLDRWLQGMASQGVLPRWLLIALSIIGAAFLISSAIACYSRMRVRKAAGQVTDMAIREERVGQQLSHSHGLLRDLVTYASDPIYTVNLDGQFTSANPAALALFGYSEEEICMLNLEAVLDPAYVPTVRDKMEQKVRDPSLQTRYEVLAYSKSGKKVWLELNSRILLRMNGPPEVLGVARDITESKAVTSGLRRMLDGTVRVAGRIAEVRDPYTAGHERRVTELACAIGRRLNLPADQIEGLRVAALIHDIGKVAIPAEILIRPGRLGENEFQLVKAHPQTAFQLLQDVEFPWPVARIILQHHERMDGSGYPASLKRDDILLEARIIAVADVVEAMASHRPYRPALGVDAALREISDRKGDLYDPAVVDACVTLFNEEGFAFSSVMH